MNVKELRKKKAISPILATVILIAITLIAAVAIAGFVFGLFSSFTSSANVSGSVSYCSVSAGVCVVTLTNTGTANASVQGCSIQNSGAAETGTVETGTTHATPVITAGAAGEQVVCSVGAGHISSIPGATAVGEFSMSNGATVTFSGVWNS